jgi:general secretion pathway protein C
MNIASQTQSLLNGVFNEKSMPKWLEIAISRHLPMLVVAVLILIIAAQAADLTWRLVPAPESGAMSTQHVKHSPVARPDAQDKKSGLETLAKLHLFGEAGKASPVKKIDQKAPETRLNLTLHGVFVDEDPEKGEAIIGTSGSTQKYYKVGATLMNGVTLRGVFNDRVVLLRNGQSEVLRFPKVPSSGSLASTSRGRSSSKSGRTSSVNSTALRGFRDQFTKEPMKIFEHVRFVPVRSREGLKGYRVLPQKNRELYNKLGIRPSDLVTAVNGVPLNNTQEAMKLMQTLQDAQSLQVDIIRGGQSQSLTFSLN